jgi:hypothetical protein
MSAVFSVSVLPSTALMVSVYVGQGLTEDTEALMLIIKFFILTYL